MENEMEARDLQRAWGHTSGTIWWACLHHSCDLPDRQVAPVWGHCVHSQSLFAETLAGLLATPSQGATGDNPLALAEESYNEKQHLALAFQPKSVLEEEAHQGKFRVPWGISEAPASPRSHRSCILPGPQAVGTRAEAPLPIRKGEGAQRKRCRDPRCSPRGTRRVGG